MTFVNVNDTPITTTNLLGDVPIVYLVAKQLLML